MELQNIYFVAEIAAAIAVFGSLVFVGMQLRQGNAATLASNAQASVNNWNQMSLLLATDERLIKFQEKGIHPDIRGLVTWDEDQSRYGYYMSAGMKAIESNFLQWKAGNLSDDTWQSFRVATVDIFVLYTHWHDYWALNQHFHPLAFRKMVDGAIKEAEIIRAQRTQEFASRDRGQAASDQV